MVRGERLEENSSNTTNERGNIQMIIKGKKYSFNIKKLLGNIGKLTTFILLELSFTYMFVVMLGAIIERYN